MEVRIMKKIIIVDSSPRKGGNCDVITDKLCESIHDAEVEVFKLRETTVNPCHGCNACKGKEKASCVQKDDFGSLIPWIDSCDALVLVSPVYFGQLNGPAKTFIDRTYCFFDPSKPAGNNASARGKKGAVIMCCGAGPADVYSKVAESTAKCFSNFGVDDSRVFVGGGVNTPGSFKDHADYMKAVGDIAEWLSE